MTHPDGLSSQLLADLVDELDPRPALELVLRPVTALHLAGLLQLVLRHPDLRDANRQVATSILEAVRAYFVDAPAALEVLRRGDDPTQDINHL
jgi:hypothetical protein